MQEDDELILIDDDPIPPGIPPNLNGLSPWKVLIIDDDQEVHSVTKLVLSDFEWEQRSIEFLDAYSAKDALQILRMEKDIAVGLVDVVMETDDAGLRLIKEIREQLDNHTIRLILRTGQPGQAPERQVIREYDVSDYKNKTELSSVKLDTLMCASLRSYRDIINLEKNRQGLETIIDSSAKIFKSLTREILAKESHHRLLELIEMCAEQESPTLSAIVMYHQDGKFDLIETSGDYAAIGQPGQFQALPAAIQHFIQTTIHGEQNIYEQDRLRLKLNSSSAGQLILCVTGFGQLSDQCQKLIDLFASNIKISFDNEELRHELKAEQRKIAYR